MLCLYIPKVDFNVYTALHSENTEKPPPTLNPPVPTTHTGNISISLHFLLFLSLYTRANAAMCIISTMYYICASLRIKTITMIIMWNCFYITAFDNRYYLMALGCRIVQSILHFSRMHTSFKHLNTSITAFLGNYL